MMPVVLGASTTEAIRDLPVVLGRASTTEAIRDLPVVLHGGCTCCARCLASTMEAIRDLPVVLASTTEAIRDLPVIRELPLTSPHARGLRHRQPRKLYVICPPLASHQPRKLIVICPWSSTAPTEAPRDLAVVLGLSSTTEAVRGLPVALGRAPTTKTIRDLTAVLARASTTKATRDFALASLQPRKLYLICQWTSRARPRPSHGSYT